MHLPCFLLDMCLTHVNENRHLLSGLTSVIYTYDVTLHIALTSYSCLEFKVSLMPYADSHLDVLTAIQFVCFLSF